ncbi:hypothetical protein [Micromonospora sp. SH-82]|uniref:hypothetical protein n=1 Tax=Micromonospora sp. SH-82 TaxID=3132938 RepID=UPI003EBBB9B1
MLSAFLSSPPTALAAPGQYPVESSWKLADQVRQMLKSKDLDIDVRPVPELAELQVRNNVRPLELLLGLGKTTSALPGLAIPGAGGLPGLAALRTASRWAIIRYLWAFAENRPDLRLSALTEQVRSHQRTLFSEQFGIAVATDLVEQVILDRPAQVVDADAVSYDWMLGTEVGGLGTHRPDYFWYGTEAGKLRDVLVVEVKGTSGRRTQSVKQLCRGIQQVSVPKQIKGVTMRRIVIGVTLAGGHLKALAVETAEQDPSLRWRASELLAAEESAGIRAERHPFTTQQHPAGYEAAVESRAVRDRAIDLDQARLLSFAGVPVAPGMVWELRRQVQSTISELEVVNADGTAFRCETTRIPLGDRMLEVRTGVAEELLAADNPLAAEQRRGTYFGRREGGRYNVVRGTSRGRPGVPLDIVTSPDGCMLSVSF